MQSPLDPKVRGVGISHPSRPIYPDLRFDKHDLARLYAELADWMLLDVARRPLTLVRCDKGVRRADALRSECQFLRHEAAYHRWAPKVVRRVSIREQKKIGEYLVVDSPEALVALAQGGIVEIHAWNATTGDLEHPDRMVLDLDPGANVAWASVVEAAHWLREALEQLGLRSFAKLTGSRGVHVVVPFLAEYTWEEVYLLSRKLAEAFTRKRPETFTTEFSRHGRESKILLDYKRNHRGAVAIAAYSPRARPSGSVAVPVAWRELTPSIAPDQWTVLDIRKRLLRLATDPWQELWTLRQRLKR